MVQKSMADVVREEGRKEGREEGRKEGREEGRKEGAVEALQKILLRQMRSRFGKVPKAVERAVTATDDLARLATWLDRFVTAQTLNDVGIEPPPA
jgi:predicted transposase YdaD